MSPPPLKNGAGAFCIRVYLSVCEFVRPESLVSTISQKPIKEIHPISVTCESGFIDVLFGV